MIELQSVLWWISGALIGSGVTLLYCLRKMEEERRTTGER